MIRQRGGAQLIRNENWNLEDKDFVSLDGVKVIIQGEEDLRGGREKLEHQEVIVRVYCMVKA